MGKVKLLYKIVGIALAVILIGSCSWFLFATKTVIVQVKETSWEHISYLQEYKMRISSAQEEWVPFGARKIRCWPVFKWNSATEMTEFETWCDYEDWYWDTINTQTYQGFNLNQTSWHNFGHVDGETKRVVRNATYTITFIKENESWKYTTSNLDDAQRFKKTKFWEIKYNKIGMVFPQKQVGLEETK